MERGQEESSRSRKRRKFPTFSEIGDLVINGDDEVLREVAAGNDDKLKEYLYERICLEIPPGERKESLVKIVAGSFPRNDRLDMGLVYLCQKGELELVKYLLMNVVIHQQSICTAMYHASSKGHLNILKMITESRSDVGVDPYLNNCLWSVPVASDFQCLDYLFKSYPVTKAGCKYLLTLIHDPILIVTVLEKISTGQVEWSQVTLPEIERVTFQFITRGFCNDDIPFIHRMLDFTRIERLKESEVRKICYLLLERFNLSLFLKLIDMGLRFHDRIPDIPLKFNVVKRLLSLTLEHRLHTEDLLVMYTALEREYEIEACEDVLKSLRLILSVRGDRKVAVIPKCDTVRSILREQDMIDIKFRWLWSQIALEILSMPPKDDIPSFRGGVDYLNRLEKYKETSL